VFSGTRLLKGFPGEDESALQILYNIATRYYFFHASWYGLLGAERGVVQGKSNRRWFLPVGTRAGGLIK
jgi:hypothetical protein